MFSNGSKFLCRFTLILHISALLLVASAAGALAQDSIKVAVATNFIMVMDVIADGYEKQTGVKIKRSSSASGILYSQIMNHAPFDLFLSADEKRAALLHRQGLCEEPFTYATGEVVLWSGRSDLKGSATWQEAVLRDDLGRLAIPNPATAPYGEAAVQSLSKQGLLKKVRDRLVFGQNVGQAFQYAKHGSADIAFVARTYTLSEYGREGITWQVPEAEPVIQDGCILSRSAKKESVREFVAYLATAEAKIILSAYGYQ